MESKGLTLGDRQPSVQKRNGFSHQFHKSDRHCPHGVRYSDSCHVCHRVATHPRASEVEWNESILNKLDEIVSLLRSININLNY